MQYSRLHWAHSFLDEPVEISSEYDSAGRERRKVELFADGSLRFASEDESSLGCELSLIRRPIDKDVINEPEFRITALTADEFEAAWERAHPALTEAG